MDARRLPVELDRTPFAEPQVPSGVMEGWWPLLAEAHERLSQVDPGYQVAQFKEKFGALRLYIRPSDIGLTEQIHAVVADLERRSLRMCERCGLAGALREGRWLQTLCDEHADGRAPTGHRDYLLNPFGLNH